jgi:hypothetical protein
VLSLLAGAALAVAAQTPPPTTNPADLNPLITHYKGLKNVTYTIIHHGDIGAPDKDIAERVYWTKGRFEITPIAYGPDPAPNMPKLVASDGQVNILEPDGSLKNSPIDPGPTSIGTWEAQGGLVLVWLMEGKTWKRMVEPQENVVLKFSVGDAKTWHEHPVREVVLTANGHKSFSIFLSPKGDAILGTQSQLGPNTVWTEYADFVETE